MGIMGKLYIMSLGSVIMVVNNVGVAVNMFEGAMGTKFMIVSNNNVL